MLLSPTIPSPLLSRLSGHQRRISRPPGPLAVLCALVFLLSGVAACHGDDPTTSDGGTGIVMRVRYCASVGACALSAPRGFSSCASSDDGPPLLVQQCLAAAGSDCTAAYACTWDGRHGDAGVTASLCAFGATPRCDGFVALTCDGMTTTTSEIDCALGGLVCVASATAARCVLATCTAPGAVSYCQGSIAVGSCARPFLKDGIDCAARSATCVEPPDGGVALCRGSGSGGCFGATCDGDTLIDCLDSHQAPRPCPSGEHCYGPTQVLSRGTCGLAGDCNPSTFFDRCDEPHGKLQYCRRGRIETIDCQALGYTGCTSSPSSGCGQPVDTGDGGRPLTDAALP